MKVLTEEDALDKWCPFARVLNIHMLQETRNDAPDIPEDSPVVSEGNVHNRMYVEEDDDSEAVTAAPGSYCIGSKCMAWQVWDESTGKGYCGLVQS